MSEAKIQLSPTERELVTDASVILTKNAITAKVKDLLALLQDQQSQFLAGKNWNEDQLPASSPKISKGENYKGLPYLVLDYPRRFEQEDIFAVRVMFWWGHFFSISLHLSGKYKKRWEQKIIAAYPMLSSHTYIAGENAGQWVHDINEDYQLISALSQADLADRFKQGSFIKLSRKYPLEQWDDIIPLLLNDFKEMLVMLID